MPDAQIQPYLFFAGRCEEALAFYKTAIGAAVEMVMLFKDSPLPPPPVMLPPGFEHKVMHASFRVGNSVILASDGCDTTTKPAGYSLSLSLKTEQEVEKAFAALSAGGRVTAPLEKTFWSPRFGMVVDRFGVAWMVTVAAA